MNTPSKDNKGKSAAIGIVLKLLLLVALGGVILFLSFWAVFLGGLGGSDALVYSAMALALFGIPLLITSIFIRRIKFKTKVCLWCGLFVLFLTPNLIELGYESYDRSFARVRETGISVADYRPFAEGTKAVYLDESSTLSLTDPLPKLDGARALYPVYSAFAQAVYPERVYDFNSEVGYNNTIGAYERLIGRDADIIFVAAPSQQQRQNAQDKGVEIQFTPIGQDAFVFFVNANNPVDNLTSAQIRDIYGGKIRNWREVGGNNQSIRAFQRNEGSGSQSAFLTFMGESFVMFPPTEDVVQGMGMIIERTSDYANYANSIGFSFRYFSQEMVDNNDIKLLSVDGVYPSVETVSSGAYPLSMAFYAATLADNSKPEVAQMIKWILSPQGQKIVEQTGYVRIQ